MEVNAKFRAPLRDGDTLDLHLSIEAWDRKALRLSYEGHVNGKTAVLGSEVRGLFKAAPTGIMAADMQDLRAYLEHHGYTEKEN
jgi:4-hydroxybenzoyl-CoA thioesterase